MVDLYDPFVVMLLNLLVMDIVHRQNASIRKQKASNPSIRPLNLPRLAKNTSRLIDIDKELEQVRERLLPLM